MCRLDVSDDTGDLSNYTQMFEVWKRQPSVSIFAACDVDGHLAASGLTALLRREGLAYSLVYVSGFSDLRRELSASSGGVGVLLNCGAVADLSRLAPVTQDFQLFVFDAHRPIHPANLACRHVFVLDKDATFLASDENEPSSPVSKRPRLDDDEDDSKLPEYIAEPSTQLVFEFGHACRVAGDLWSVAVAVSSYRLLGKYTLQKYLTMAHALDQQYIASRENMEISFQSELCMPLFRHHSLHGALGVSAYVYGTLELHRDYGRRVLLQLLAYAGIPIDQSNQLFISMSLPVKLKLKNGKFADACKQFNLEDISMYDFMLRKAHEEFSASDVALAALTALGEGRIAETSDAERRGTAVSWLRDVATQTKIILDRRSAKIKRKIRFVKIDQPASKAIAENIWVGRLLGVFLATVFQHKPGGADSHRKFPVLLAIKQTSDRYRVIAIDIWTSDSLFHRHFKFAAMDAGTQIQSDYFDTEIADIPVADFDKWTHTLFANLGEDEDSEISDDNSDHGKHPSEEEVPEF